LQGAPPPQKPTHSKFWQMSPAGHWLSFVQPTHWPVCVRQCGFVAGHWLSLVQPGMGWQVCVATSHDSPVGQVSGFVRQATQTPAGSSQYGVAGVPAQSLLVVQPVAASPSAFASVCASTPPSTPPSNEGSCS
jgi:hypothetical protein